MKRRAIAFGILVAASTAVFVGYWYWPSAELDLAGHLRQVVADQGFDALSPPLSDLRPGDIHPPDATWRGCWKTSDLHSASLADIRREIAVDRRAAVRHGLRLLRDLGVDVGADARRVSQLRFHAEDWRVSRANGFEFAWDAPDCWTRVARQDRLSVVGGTLAFGSMRVEAVDQRGQALSSTVLAGVPSAGPRSELSLGEAASDHLLLAGDSLVVGVQPHGFHVRRFACEARVRAGQGFQDIGGCPRWDGSTEAWYRVRVLSGGQGRVALRVQEAGGPTTRTFDVDTELGLEVALTTHSLRHDRAVVREEGDAFHVEIRRYELQPDLHVGYQTLAFAAGDSIAGVDGGPLRLFALVLDSTEFGAPADASMARARPLPDQFAQAPLRLGGPGEAVIRHRDVTALCRPGTRARQSPGLCVELAERAAARSDAGT